MNLNEQYGDSGFSTTGKTFTITRFILQILKQTLCFSSNKASGHIKLMTIHASSKQEYIFNSNLIYSKICVRARMCVYNFY